MNNERFEIDDELLDGISGGSISYGCAAGATEGYYNLTDGRSFKIALKDMGEVHKFLKLNWDEMNDEEMTNYLLSKNLIY